MLKNEQIDS